MVGIIEEFNQFPRSVRAVFQTFVIAWGWHYFSLYQYFLKGDVPIEQIAIGVMLFISLVMFKKWGRVLSMIFNFLAVIWYLRLAVLFYYGDKNHLIYVAAVNVFLFGVSTYFLLTKDTADFFKLKTDEKDKERAKEIEQHTKKIEQAKKKRTKKN